MTIMERRLVTNELKKAKERHVADVKELEGFMRTLAQKDVDFNYNDYLPTPEIDSLIDLLGAGKV